jgi:hypothetical protein
MVRGGRSGSGTAFPIFSLSPHSFIDLGAIPSVLWRKLHDRIVNISIDHQKVLVRFFRPFR